MKTRGLRASAKAAPAVVADAAAEGATTEATAPPLLLAHSWEGDVDLTGWWMSEKLDGVRAYWDGNRFLSRLGNVYKAPGWFTKGLPKTPLDGELWVGRKKFQRCVSIVRRHEAGEDWKEVSYLVFDAPALRHKFEDRMDYLQKFMQDERPDQARHLEQVICRGTSHMKEELARVEALGGEGVMMRRPGSHYEIGRSHSLLKVKSFYDTEAIVVGHQPGTGKHKGRLGALLVEMPNGTRFAVGTGLSDAERNHPPAVGQIITYRYQELSDGGVPRFPSYIGVRHDVKWPPSAKK
jgi:DNA ligase-1